MIFMKIFLLNFYRFFTFFIAKLQHKIINLTKLKEKFKFFLFLVVFLFEKWTQNFQNFWIVVADFPPLDPPCLYDLSYGRRLDPNTKAFSAAYNDAVDIANKNRLTFLALEYATNPENMRLQCVFSHFQRRKTGLPILQQQLKLFFLQFSKKKSGGVDTATTIKVHFLSLKSSKNRWNLGFQPVHMRDHKDRGGRFCNYNSTSIHTRFRHKIDKIMKRFSGYTYIHTRFP